MYVTGMAIETEGLLKQVEASQADVLLLDWHLRGASTMDLLADIQGLESSPKIVVLSNRSGEKDPALSAGADAFISKSAQPEEMLELIRSFRVTTAGSAE